MQKSRGPKISQCLRRCDADEARRTAPFEIGVMVAQQRWFGGRAKFTPLHRPYAKVALTPNSMASNLASIFRNGPKPHEDVDALRMQTIYRLQRTTFRICRDLRADCR